MPDSHLSTAGRNRHAMEPIGLHPGSLTVGPNPTAMAWIGRVRESLRKVVASRWPPPGMYRHPGALPFVRVHRTRCPCVSSPCVMPARPINNEPPRPIPKGDFCQSLGLPKCSVGYRRFAAWVAPPVQKKAAPG